MRAQITAEIFWMLRRRAPPLTALLSVVSGLAVSAARWVSTSGNVAGAVEKAQADAAEALSRGLDIPAEALYVEPRYELAAQLPVDVAALSLGVALLALVAAAVSVGGDWRTGTVRLSFPTLDARASPTVVRIVAWWVAGIVAGATSLTLCNVGLLAVGHAGGLSEELSTAATVGIALRGTAIVGAAAAFGAAAATAVRSDVAVVAATLLYVLVAELLLVGLLGVSGYQSPGARAHMLVAGQLVGPSTEVDIGCGAALRCPVVHEISSGSPTMHLVLAAALVGMTLLAIWSARRPVWR